MGVLIIPFRNMLALLLEVQAKVCPNLSILLSPLCQCIWHEMQKVSAPSFGGLLLALKLLSLYVCIRQVAFSYVATEVGMAYFLFVLLVEIPEGSFSAYCFS